jgi:hypothetical protein
MREEPGDKSDAPFIPVSFYVKLGIHYGDIRVWSTYGVKGQSYLKPKGENA